MEEKEQIIQDLCLMYGSGYLGPVELNLSTGKIKQNLTHDTILHAIRTNRSGSLWGVFVPQKSFTDLLKKDAEGGCDAERVAGIAFNPFNDHMQMMWECKTVMGRSKIEVSGMEENNQNVNVVISKAFIVAVWIGQNLGLCMNKAQLTDFLRSKGYLIPKSLQK